MKEEHFLRVQDGWQISATHRAITHFKTFDLLDSFNSLAKFDIIFCRNVRMYFSILTKIDILNKLHDSLNPGGYLFLSSSELIPSDASGFEAVRDMGAKCYRKT